MKRTNYCGEITAAMEGTKQTLCGCLCLISCIDRWVLYH